MIHAGRWLLLAVVPAALLLGPLVAGIAFALSGMAIKPPKGALLPPPATRVMAFQHPSDVS